MKIIHTYIKNMYIKKDNEELFTFADIWGLVNQAKLGHEVTLICGGDGDKRRQYIWKGITVIELPCFMEFTDTTRFVHGIYNELMKIEGDIFHTHHYCFLVPEITLLVGRLRRIPVFITIHTTFHGRSGIVGLLERFYAVAMQPFLHFYKEIFFISNFIKNNLYFSCIPHQKKILLHNYYQLPPKIDVDRQENSLLFIGRVTYLKGLDILFKAVSLIKNTIPNIQLNIVGEHEKKYGRYLNRLARSLDITNNVKFYGQQDGVEKWKHYYLNTLQIVPSRGEGWGNVVIEGMLCNIPVIVSNRGALEEAGGGNAIVFNIHDQKDLAEKIINLLKNKRLRQKITEKAYRYAKQFTERGASRVAIKIYSRYLK